MRGRLLCPAQRGGGNNRPCPRRRSPSRPAPPCPARVGRAGGALAGGAGWPSRLARSQKNKTSRVALYGPGARAGTRAGTRAGRGGPTHSPGFIPESSPSPSSVSSRQRGLPVPGMAFLSFLFSPLLRMRYKNVTLDFLCITRKTKTFM